MKVCCEDFLTKFSNSGSTYDFNTACKQPLHRHMIVNQSFHYPYTFFAAMVAVICPLVLLPIGSGGYWAKPILEGEDLEETENAENTRPLLVSPPDKIQSCQADDANLSSKRILMVDKYL